MSGKQKKNIADKVFKEPVKAIHLLNRLSSGEDHEHFIDLANGQTVEASRIHADKIDAWKQNVDKYRYYMVTGCEVIEIFPPDPFPDMVAKKV